MRPGNYGRNWSLRMLRTTNSSTLPHRRVWCPGVERLEDRAIPASFIAASVADLISEIGAANAAGGSNTITLAAGTTFPLTAVNNSTDGPTGLPVIANGNHLTIIGNGDIIQRSTAKGSPAFRLFDVVGGASLMLANLTLQGGVAASPDRYGFVAGGAIDNQGSLTLSEVTVQNNLVQGVNSLDAEGGGICSRGSLTVQNSTIRSNRVVGSDGAGAAVGGVSGGDARGGGLFVLGTASLINVTLSANTAQGGKGGNSGFNAEGDHVKGGRGGWGSGGGMAVGLDAVVELRNSILTGNTAAGGKAGSGNVDGAGEGGGLYIVAIASACLDGFTVANVTSNKASTSAPNIFGSYAICL